VGKEPGSDRARSERVEPAGHHTLVVDEASAVLANLRVQQSYGWGWGASRSPRAGTTEPNSLQ